MKKKYKYVIIFIVFGVVFFLLYIASFFSYKQLLPIKRVPKEYESYKRVRDGVETEKHEIVPIVKGFPENIGIVYYNKKDTTVVVRTKNYGSFSTRKPEIYKNNYYKLNAKGKIIDSLELKRNEISEIREGYLINNDSYYTWLLDGDKTRKKCKMINRDYSFTKEQAEKKLKELYDKSKYAFGYDIVLDNYSSYISAFFINNDWVFLFGDIKMSYKNEDIYPPKRVDNYDSRFVLNDIINKEDVWNKKSKVLSLKHFQKIEYEKSNKSLFTLIPSSYNHSVDKWIGEGYMHLLYQKDTIVFKMILNYELGDSNSYSGNLNFYTDSKLKFGLLACDYRLFIVRNKENNSLK